MGEIPVAQSIQTPAPRPVMDVPEEYPRQIYRPGEAGAEFADIGNTLASDSTQMLARQDAEAQKLHDQQDEMQFATARSAFLQQKALIENNLSTDPDWSTIPARYEDAIGKAQSAAAAAITNPKYQAQFGAQAGLDVTDGLIQMRNIALKKQGDAARGSLINTMETNRQTALASPSNAPGLIDATVGAINGAAANGFISQDEAAQYRQKWTSDYGKGWLTIQPDATQAQLLKDPTARTGTPADFVDPAERVIMGREAEQRLKVDNAVRQQQFSQAVADQVAYLRNGGDPSKVSISVAQAHAVYGNTPDGNIIASEITDAVKYNGLVREMALAPQSRVNDILAGQMPEGPEGFRRSEQDLNDLRSIAQARTTALANDPATYAVSADPVTGNAYMQAMKGPQQFDAYVQRLNGTYAALQQPPDARAILPKGDIVATVKNLNTMPPADAVKQIDSLAKTAGRWWPQVYSEMAQNGLPAAFQAVTIASPQDAQVMVAAMQTGKGKTAVGAGLAEEDTKKGGTIDQALDSNSGMKSLQSSLVTYGRSGVDLYNGSRQAVKQTAMYLMDQNPSLSADNAATKAAAMIAGQFDFLPQGDNPVARLPKGTLDHTLAQITAAKSALTSESVRPYPNRPGETPETGGPSDQERADAALHHAQNAWWLTVPASDGGTVLRAIDPLSGLPVILADGRKFEVHVNSANLGTVGPAGGPSGAPALPAQPVGAADIQAAAGRKLPASVARIPRAR